MVKSLASIIFVLLISVVDSDILNGLNCTRLKTGQVSSIFVNVDEEQEPDFYNYADPFYNTQFKDARSSSINLVPNGQSRPSFVTGPRGPTRRPMCSNGLCGGVSFQRYSNLYGKLFYTEKQILDLNRINRIASLRTVTHVHLPGSSGQHRTSGSSHGAAGKPRNGASGKPGNGTAGKPGNGDTLGKPGEDNGQSGPTGSLVVPDNDGDRCCPTRVSHRSVQFLDNIDGIERELVNFIGGSPALQQYIPVGTCLSFGMQTGCSNCRVEQRLHFLLVMDPNATQFPMVEFDKFYLNSYCSCKSG